MRRPAAIALLFLLATAAPARSAPPPLRGPVMALAGDAAAVAAAETVSIPMRDGVSLAGTLWRPSGPGPFPTVVLRTPYDRTAYAGWSRLITSRALAYLTVDVRGRYASGGNWEPLLHEGEDGQDVIAWVARQPWSNGKVGTQGGSYDAWVQLLAASRGVPNLAAMTLLVAPPDPFENIPFDNGAYFSSTLFWAVSNRGRTMQDLDPLTDWPAIIASYPLDRWDDLAGTPVPWLDGWLANWRFNEFWRERAYEAGWENMTVPALHVTGWFDRDQPGCIRTFQALSRHREEAVRNGQKLIVGPWMHTLEYLPSWGELSFPSDAERDLLGLMLTWMETHLKGSGQRPGAPVEYYLMGRNQWREAASWPPEDTVETSFFLAPGGRLERQRPLPATASYRYDPADPTLLADPQPPELWGLTLGHVPLDAAGVAGRADVLLFASDPLPAPLAIAGPVHVELTFSSTAEDTDMGAQLLDLTPDGRAIALTHGLSRARFREGYENPVPLIPGAPARLDVDLWSTAYELAPGHRLGVLVSSAQVPAFDAHRNLFDDLATGTARQGATQTVHLGGEAASRLVVHILRPTRPARRALR